MSHLKKGKNFEEEKNEEKSGKVAKIGEKSHADQMSVGPKSLKSLFVSKI